MFIVEQGKYWLKGEKATAFMEKIAASNFQDGFNAGLSQVGKNCVVFTLAAVWAAAITYGGVQAYKKYNDK